MKRYLLFLSGVLCSFSVSGSENIHIDWAKEITTQISLYTKDIPQSDYIDGFNDFTELKLLTRDKLTISYRSKLQFLVDILGHWTYQTKERNYLIFKDLSLNLFFEHVQASMGVKTESWKTVESISPADILNPFNYDTDFYDPEKVGEVCAAVKINLPWAVNNIMSIYYLPFFQVGDIPGRNDRFNFFQSNDDIVLKKDEYEFDSKHEKWKPQVALKYSTVFFNAFDLSLFYFHGYNRFPFFIFDYSQSTSSLEAEMLFRTMNLLGINFQGVLGNTIIKGECIAKKYLHSMDEYNTRADDENIYFNIGGEYGIYSIFNSLHDLYPMVEFIQYLSHHQSDDSYQKDSFFRNHLFMGLRYNFNNSNNRMVTIGSLIDRKDLIATLFFEYEETFHDYFFVTLFGNYAEHYYSNKDFPLLTNNHRVGLKIKVCF